MKFMRRVWDGIKEHQAEVKHKNELRAAERQRRLEQERLEHERAMEAKRQARLREQRRQDSILEILHDGKLPDVDWSNGSASFRLQKTEHLLYVFPNVRHAEEKIERKTVGKTRSQRVRVAKGFSFTVPGDPGRRVEDIVVEDRGMGVLAVTDRHLYFDGQRSFRIRWDKLVSIQPMADAVEVTRDRASGLAEFFQMGKDDAGFAYKLFQLAATLELPRKPERIAINDSVSVN